MHEFNIEIKYISYLIYHHSTEQLHKYLVKVFHKQ